MKFILLLTYLICSTAVVCQDTLSGKVVSDEGKALHGASVFISNTTAGTTTNAAGEFVLGHLPKGSFQVVVSFVGYTTTTAVIAASDRNKKYIIRLKPLSNELKDVIIGNYDKRGWEKWGDIFIEAFIGASAFAKSCVITNTDAIHFAHNKKTNMLYAYANESLHINNNALGYNIEVTLVNFSYALDTRIVDYQVYSLFKEMEGTEDEQEVWKSNRDKVYKYSLLHFMRSLYNQNYRNEGFQVRRIESAPNVEKQRIQALYKNKINTLKDSFPNNAVDEALLIKQAENKMDKDSLAYYRHVLAENDASQNIYFNTELFKNIAKVTDSSTVIFYFKDYLQVIYVKEKEPGEYLAYRKNLYVKNKLITADDRDKITRAYSGTTLSLSMDMPVEIFENGYFTNADLFMNGFWGWWEKMATALPYEYEP